MSEMSDAREVLGIGRRFYDGLLGPLKMIGRVSGEGKDAVIGIGGLLDSFEPADLRSVGGFIVIASDHASTIVNTGEQLSTEIDAAIPPLLAVAVGSRVEAGTTLPGHIGRHRQAIGRVVMFGYIAQQGIRAMDLSHIDEGVTDVTGNAFNAVQREARVASQITATIVDSIIDLEAVL